MNLHDYGWSSAWDDAFARLAEPGLVPARVVREHRDACALVGEAGECLAEVSGRFRHRARSGSDFPAVGDWVAAEWPGGESRAIVHAVLPRRSAFVRRSAGTGGEPQVVAANVDTVFLVSGLDRDFNLRRIERYLTLAHESGARAVVVLNKADVAADPGHARLQAESVAAGKPILLVSAASGAGMGALRGALAPGETGALLGSSGVGKSTIINALLGRDALRTAPVREDDDRGRHTTSHRELIRLPGGGLLIDTPGMRELQLLADDTALERSFDEIADLAGRCRFRDCTHTGEPGCAVQAAVAAGELDVGRYESYLQQRKEIRHHRIEQDVRLQNEERKRWKAIHRSLRNHPKYRREE